jgi:hypothetical protein
MPLPPHTDNLIRTRFETLVKEAEQLQRDAQAEAETASPHGIPRALTRDKVILSGASFDTLKTKFLSLLQLLAGGSGYIHDMMEDVRQLLNTPSGVNSLVGKIRGLKDDYENGMLTSIIAEIEAGVAADYLGQAEQLLEEGQPGKFDHVPAAVLSGAILEDALRRLCQRQAPPIVVVKPDGSPKTLNPLIDNLKKASVFNELKAKQLRAWADIRNAAAHGEFGQFNRQDVEQMVSGIGNFLGDYL